MAVPKLAAPVTTNLLAFALHYISLGWQVLPVHTVDENGVCSCGDPDCKKLGKHPRTRHGLKDATTDPDKVRDWWTKNPDANIGVRTGEESGIWVLDLDVKNGVNGIEEMDQFAAENPDASLETVSSRTGSGGLHCFYWWDAKQPVRSGTGVLPGVDTRGTGGYVIVPPSRHASGNVYEWVEGCAPWEIDCEAAPECILEFAADKKADAVASPPPPVDFPPDELEELEAALTHVPSDDREVWIRVGMALHSTGLGEAAYTVWSRWSATSEKFDEKDQRRNWISFKTGKPREVRPATVFRMAYDHGWQGPKRQDFSYYGVTIAEDLRVNGQPTGANVMSEECVEKPTFTSATATSGDPWYDRKPEDLHTVVKPGMAFPIEKAFPSALGCIKEYLEDVAESYQVPVDLPAMMVPPLGAVAAAKKFSVRVWNDWRENPALWSCVAMDSGERKSAVFNEMLRPITEWEWSAGEAAQEDIGKHSHKVQSLRAQLKHARDKHARKGGDNSVEMDELDRRLRLLEAQEPTVPTISTLDSTSEAVAKLLAENHERLLVAAPEADPLDIILGRYSKDPNFGIWLCGHAGDPFKTSRISRERHDVRSPSLSVLVSPQPGSLRALFGNEQAQERGFIARFLFSLPRSRVGWRDIQPPAVPQESRLAWQGIVTHLLDEPFPNEPQELGFALDAQRLWIDFMEQNEESLRPDNISERMRAWTSKLPGAIARLAYVLQVLQIPYGGSRDTIERETLESALAWVPYLKDHLNALLSAVGEDPAIVVAQKVLEWARTKSAGTFSRRDAFDRVRHRTVQLQRVADLDPALEALTDARWIRAIEETKPVSSRGGRPRSTRFQVHPHLFEGSPR